jgi:type IV fimbrial biogenesis protein FimT
VLKQHHTRGLTIIELMIALVILVMIILMSAPSFTAWIQNLQIRGMSESMLQGLQLARAEAVRRNAAVRFELMSNLTGSCALSTTGRDWVISMDGAAGACDSTSSADAASPAAPRMIRVHPGRDGAANAAVSASQSSIVFNGLGRVTPVPAADITVDVSNPTGGACAASSGPMRCLRVVVTAAGQIKMCDTRMASSTSEGC